MLILPAAYLPPVPYLAAILHETSALIEQHENYPKQTLRNRCHIAGPNGLQQLVVPVNKVSGPKTLIKDIRISYSENWHLVHWRSIEAAYNSSPFFQYYRDDFLAVLMKKMPFLLDLNMELLKLLLDLIKIRTCLTLSSGFIKEYPSASDFRYGHFGKMPLVSAVEKPYYQVFADRHGFLPGLSAIDLLFNEGPMAGDYLERY